MPLSRLENFLKNVEGNILYVNPTDLDATDSIENQGNSLTKPFKTLQRALLEASRFAYQIGQNNDKFDRTTIILYPGTHEIDNRPGYNVTDNGDGTSTYRDRNGNVVTLSELTNDSNYNLESSANELYKYNSVDGGVIIPRGVSIVGLDLRKTKIRPKFVPDPETDSINPSGIFKVTGGCYFWQFSIFDGDPNNTVYKNYSTDRFTPSFSHHKLTAFEYCDGVNAVGVGTSSTNTDLQMYYWKIQGAFGNSSGRSIGDYPGTTDMQPRLPEFTIVGEVVTDDVGISSIKAGVGSKTNTSTDAQVDTSVPHGLNVNSPFRVTGITTYPTIWNGNFVVTGVTSERRFNFSLNSAPTDGLPDLNGSEKIVADTDTVTGASPYIFNISLRSVYGMNGLHADGSKADGFKSMVVAQFTGIGLQKDNNAFLYYNESTGAYDTNATVDESEKPLYLNTNSIYRPSYENSHIKCSNNAILQVVSVFAIGYAQHFSAVDGGDQSITNSNSNFGAKSLIANGFRDTAFDRDDVAYISHVIPPKNIVVSDKNVEWLPVDVGLTTAPVGVGTTTKVFIYGFTDESNPPNHVVDSFRVGAKFTDELKLSIAGVGTFATPIYMPTPDGTEGLVGRKEYQVRRVGAANSIVSSVVTLDLDHKLYAGESIRVVSDNGHLPDGLDNNTVYFAITNDSQNETLNSNQIKIAKTRNDALLGGSGNFITISNSNGGVLKIESRVSDKVPGDLGHPIQYDSSNSNWYITGAGSTTLNTLWQAVVDNQDTLGDVSGKTFLRRKVDNRNLTDKVYKLRYVIPKEESVARPPIAGFILQESSTVGVATASEFTNNLPSSVSQRNLHIIKSVDRDSNTGVCTAVTELPHNFVSGDTVFLTKIKSSSNPVGTANSGFNGSFTVTGITSSKGFTYELPSVDPGTFVNENSTRSDALPVVSRKKYNNSLYVYRIDTLREHKPDEQDGVYHIIAADASVRPTVNEFTDKGYSQNVVNLYPQLDNDNFDTDPVATQSFALNKPIGEVVSNTLKSNLTKETTNTFIKNNRIGFAVTFAEGSTAGISTIYTDVEHNFNRIINVGIGSSGIGYGAGVSTTIYNANLVYAGISTGSGATVNIDVDANGGITSVRIVDGGSAYGVGHTLRVTGVQTNTGFVEGWVTVNKINDNIGDAVQIVGVGTTGNRFDSGYNGIHTITSVTPKTISYNNGTNPGIYTAGSSRSSGNGLFFLSGRSSGISTVTFASVATGIVTVTTSTPHGLDVGNTFKIVGVAQTVYNGTFVVSNKVGINTFTFKMIEGRTNTDYVSGGQVLPITYGANDTASDVENERIGNRLNPIYAGISTTINSSGITTNSTTLTLTSADGFQKGDFVQIDSEVIRIASDFSSDAATVLRGQLGSRKTSHEGGQLVKKIRVVATEGRRNSILRASGHTFEYLGFGPGNYSTALPQKQARVLSKKEQLFAQSERNNGGVIVYTGMNDAGDFYIGNKRISSNTGQEETVNIPVPTTTGEDNEGTARLSVIFDDTTINDSLKVEGGSNNILASQFNGPVNFTKKITSTATDGVEAIKMILTGDVTDGREITVSSSVPTTTATEGDIVFNASPSAGGFVGWVFTSNSWKRFGFISMERDSDILSVSKVGIGSTNPSRADRLDVRGGAAVDDLVVSGVSTFVGTVNFGPLVFQDITVSGISTFSGSANSINQTSGTAALNRLTVAGVSTFSGNLDVNASVDIQNDVTVGGALTVTGDLTLDEINARNISVTNTASGISTLGLARATDLTVSGVSTMQTVVPSADDTYDLGSSSSQWRNLYVDGLAELDDVNVGGATTMAGDLRVGTTDLFVDVDANRVGINSGTLSYTLNVGGDINVTGSDPKIRINGTALSPAYLEAASEGKTVGIHTQAGLGVGVDDGDFIGNGTGRATFQVGAGASSFFVGAGSTARVGIGSTIPRATFDVEGLSAVGGAPQYIDKYGIIKFNRAKIINDTTVPANSDNGFGGNASSIGPVEIDTSITVTVDDGGNWVIG